MGRPLACAVACSLMLLPNLCSAQPVTWDVSGAPIGVDETLTAAATVRAQARLLAFAEIILPDTARTRGGASGLPFAQLTWLMPLPDYSTSKVTVGPRFAAVPSLVEDVAVSGPTGSAPDEVTVPATEPDSEPFGLQTARAPQGLLWVKWRKVRRTITAGAPALMRCRTEASRCSEAAGRFVTIVDEAARHRGRARLELVNQRINAAIRYVSDKRQWRRSDLWSAPLDANDRGSFDTGMGDCEDYAIAKYVALLEAGTPARDLRLLMVRDTTARTYHAVLAARLNGQWLLLDNRWRRLIADDEARFFTPLFALNAAGVERFAAARPDNRRAHIRRAARTPDRLVLAGERGPVRGEG